MPAKIKQIQQLEASTGTSPVSESIASLELTPANLREDLDNIRFVLQTILGASNWGDTSSLGFSILDMRSGTVAVANSASDTTITYSSAFSDTNYNINVNLRTPDASSGGVIIPLAIVDKQTTECTVEFASPIPATGNYYLEYIAIPHQ